MRSNVPEIFGSMVFNDSIMRDKLPKDIYRSLRKTIEDGKDLDIAVANVVAIAMKDWAIEQGATHYTHWFQPLTGITAEKHDSFISPQNDGRVIMEFSGKNLIKGEPDASSFPSGGLCATFEARGYTAWDPTSYAFVKDGVLCIPTAFCSYGGEALDKKTPLLRSMEAINEQALRVIRLFGDTDVKKINTTVGAEQEYFLIDEKVYRERKDLYYCGRTLFGAPAPKGQEMSDHYFGAIKPRILAFMRELNEELWKHGILANTEHNEVSPAQHELAPIYTTTNISVDHNQLTMEIMKNVARHHGMVCVLHEKPFQGVNGSGKHNNWSLSTDTGVNLLNPGKSPHENAQFLLFLAAVIKAVDEYQDLLRYSVAYAGNDNRLGGDEAPPTVMSLFIGDDLAAVLESIENGTDYDAHSSKMEIGVHVLPTFTKDSTDPNPTSPFALTANKFEFRSPGSSQSIAGPNVVLNTIVAEELRQFADELEKADDFTDALSSLLKRTIKEHKRIIFNGDGYSEEWRQEAERRGLLNLPSAVDAFQTFLAPKNVELFARHKVFTETEMVSRYEISLDTYAKIIRIEGMTMVNMARKQILPAVNRYLSELSTTVNRKGAIGSSLQNLGADASGAQIRCKMEVSLISKLSALLDQAFEQTEDLAARLDKAAAIKDELETAVCYRDQILPAMNALRASCDAMEVYTPADIWPFPTYGDLLFSVD